MSSNPGIGPALAIGVVVIRMALRAIWRGSGGKAEAEGEGQPDLDRGGALFKARRWDELVTLFADRRPSDRYHFLRGLALLTKLDRQLPKAPTDDLAIVTAGVLVGWAWRHRSGKVGSKVSEGGALRFVQHLQRADALLSTVSPSDSVACALRIRIAMGLDGSRGALHSTPVQPISRTFLSRSTMSCLSLPNGTDRSMK